MIRDLLSLTGKNALVTGSSQGIGQAIALGLAEFGANVLIHNHKGDEEAQQVADQVRQMEVKSHAIGVDLTDPDAPDQLLKRATELIGSIDILVLNASMQLPEEWNETTPEQFDKQVVTNWKSTLFLMQVFLPGMVERGWGRILTIGSVQELRPHPAMIVYAGTKAAIANTVRNLALQVAQQGVTVNNLSPGVINTSRIQEPTPDVEPRIAQRQDVPIGYPGEPADCSGMALLLCSEAGRYITGQTIFVDGGMSL